MRKRIGFSSSAGYFLVRASCTLAKKDDHSFGLGGKKGESVMGGYQETVTNFGARNGRLRVRLLVKIAVCFGPD